MKKEIMRYVFPACLILALLILAEKNRTPGFAQSEKSYAIYAEYAKESNKLMQPGLNRRVFNKVEAQSGSDIRLNEDGSILLNPGTYRVTGFSMITMQTTFAPPQPKNNNNYPGFCLVYPKQFEKDRDASKHAIGLGSAATASDMAPSIIDLIYTFKTKTEICMGHQAGQNLNNEVYLSIYEVAGIKSDDHVLARLAITKL